MKEELRALNIQSTRASTREVIRFSKFNEDRKLRDARGL